jgi:hypothetical protein
MFCLDKTKLPNKDTSLPTKFTNFLAKDFFIFRIRSCPGFNKYKLSCCFLVKVCAVKELAAILAIEKSNKNLFENNLVDRILFLCDDLKHKEKLVEINLM